VRCQSCNAISLLDPSRQAQNCPFCGAAQLVPYAETKRAFRPEGCADYYGLETDVIDVKSPLHAI